MLTRTLIALLALSTPFSAALACAPPSEAWAIAQTWPADGAAAVAPDAPLMILGRELDWSSFSFAGQLTVQVTLDGEPVEGALAAEPSTDLALWWPAEPWRPGATYQAHLLVENTYSDHGTPEEELRLQFTAGEAMAPAATAPVAEVEVAGWVRELTRCVEDAPPGYCGDCMEYEVVGHEDRLRVRAALPAPEGGATWTARLKAAPSAELLAERGPVAARHFLDGAAVVLTPDLGPRASWGSDEVCVQAEQVDAQGRVAAGEVQCFALAPADEAPDVEREAAAQQGCSASGDAPANPLWLLLCLPLLRRRQRR